MPLLESLEKELTDLVSGFDVKIWSLRAEGEKAFGTPAEEAEEESPASEETTTASIAPAPTAEEPVYSVSPVPNTDSLELDLESAEEVIIGKSKENILAAFEQAGLNAHIDHEEL